MLRQLLTLNEKRRGKALQCFFYAGICVAPILLSLLIGLILGRMKGFIVCTFICAIVILALVGVGLFYQLPFLHTRKVRKLAMTKGTAYEATFEKALACHGDDMIYRAQICFDRGNGPETWISPKYDEDLIYLFPISGKCLIHAYNKAICMDYIQPWSNSGVNPGKEKRLTYEAVLSSELTAKQQQQVLRRLMYQAGTFEADSFRITYPVEKINELEGEEQSLAKEEWGLLSNVITERFFRFAIMHMVPEDETQPPVDFLVEVRYHGGCPDSVNLFKIELEIKNALKELAKNYKDKEKKFAIKRLTKKIDDIVRDNMEKVTPENVYVAHLPMDM